jgi:hypothetical protein
MRLRQIVPLLASSVLVLACGLGELFSSPKVGDVVLTYTGAEVLTIGDRAPVAVTVTVGGALLPNPRLTVTPRDTSIIGLSPNGDTLIARDRGFDTLTIRLVASIFTDSFPTILQPVRVNP